MKTWTKHVLSIGVTLALLGTTTLAAAADITLGKYVKVYKGKEGATVALALSRDNKSALVRVTGLSHALDGKVLLCEQKEWGRNASGCSTLIDGRKWGIFSTERSRWGGEGSYVWLPGMEKFPVSFDEKASKKVKGAALLAAYTKLKKSGALAKLQAFKRKEEEQRQERDLESARTSLAKACGKQIAVSIDWSTVTDDDIKKYSIYSFCKDNVGALRSACDKKPAYKAAVAKKVQKAVCKYGKEHKIRIEGGTATFQIDFNKSNQSDVARNIVENAL